MDMTAVQPLVPPYRQSRRVARMKGFPGFWRLASIAEEPVLSRKPKLAADNKENEATDSTIKTAF